MGKVLASAAAILACCVASASEVPTAPPLVEFEFLGCSGGWDGELKRPEAWRVVGDGKVTFLTRSVETCGLKGRSAVATGDLQQLDLRYEFFSTSEGVVMCDCEYWAKFTFGSEAHTVKSVTFNGQPVALRGEWPED